jgi:hypothetical protein
MSDNLQALDALITTKANEQAAAEWEDFLDLIDDWVKEHPMGAASCTIHGSPNGKHLSAFDTKACDAAERDAMRSMCSGVNAMGPAFLTARAKVVAQTMAEELLKKTSLIR